MRFLVDAQLSPEVAVWLRAKGHEDEHVFEALSTISTDRAIFGHAIRLAAVIVSKDRDFVSLVEEDAGTSSQLIWVRVGNAVNRLLLSRLEVEWARIESELDTGARVVELH